VDLVVLNRARSSIAAVRFMGGRLSLKTGILSRFYVKGDRRSRGLPEMVRLLENQTGGTDMRKEDRERLIDTGLS